MDRIERQWAISREHSEAGGPWATRPELASAVAAAASDARSTETRTVELTIAELRALDDMIQVGARAVITARRGDRLSLPAELGIAQRKVQHAYATFPRAARLADLDAAHQH